MRPLRLVCLTLLVALLATPSAGAHDEVRIVGERTFAGQVEPIATHVDPVGTLKPPAAGVAEPLTPFEPVAPGAQLPETWCGAKRADDNTVDAVHPAGTPDVKAVYAIASDGFATSRDARFATVADRMQADASAVARHVAAASGGRRTIRFDRGTDCGAEYLDIQAVVLPRPLAEYRDANGMPLFNRLVGDLRGLVAGAAPRNWFVYLDGFDNAYASGQGHFYPEAEQPDAVPHDRGGLFALTYGQTTLPSNAYANPTTMLHEIGHNIGAVGFGAPNSTGAAHCVDEWDVMCYAENGRPVVVDETNCARDTTRAIQQNWDCKGDDYFNARPTAGSYLDESWNTFHSAHLGACSTELAATCGLAGAAPDGTPPRNTTPRASTTWHTADYTVALSATDAESGVAGHAWRVDGGPAQTTTTATVSGDGTHALQTRMRDAAGNWSPWRTDTVRIDTGAPVAAVSCPSGWLTVASSCTASVPSPGADFDRLEVQVGSGAVLSHAATSRVVPVAAEGETAVRARARDLAGNVSAWAAATIRQDLAAPLAGVACPSGWQSSDASCTVTGSDSAAPLASLTWEVDGGATQSGPSGSTVTVGAGIHTVSATATDAAGRTKTASAAVKVDKTAPVATLSCPTSWVRTGSCTVTGTDAESGLVDRQVSVAGLAPVSALDGLYTVLVPGRTTLAGRVVNGAGTPSGWTADAAVRVDAVDPAVSLSCERLGPEGRHRCTATASDEESGVASVRLLRDGAWAEAVMPSEPFEATGPVALAAVATDAAGRSATSAVRALDGATAPAPPTRPVTAVPPVTLPPPPGPGPSAPVPPAGPREASARVGGAGRSLATGSVAVTASAGGASAALELAPARLGRGTWRLEACAGSRCVRRTVTLRRPGTPKALRARLAVPEGDVRARFTVLRRSGRAFRRHATRTAVVPAA